jgi:hypothetical protein
MAAAFTSRTALRKSSSDSENYTFLEMGMRPLIGMAVMVGVGIAGSFASAGPANAEIVIAIDKSIQRMAVVVDGRE